MNRVHRNIRFTTEIGKDRITFLDLNLRIDQGRLSYGIYRKPTATDALIPKDSGHPWSQKLSAFHWLIGRLMQVPLSKEDFNKEKCILQFLAEKNGYEPTLIDSIMRQKERRELLREVYGSREDTKPPQNWCSLTYIEQGTEKIANILRREGFFVAYRPTRNLKKLLSKPKDKVKDTDRSGVYSVTCGSCPATYVGKTGRRLSSRIAEHNPSTSKPSHVKDHLRKTGHLFKEENVKLLRAVDEGPRLDVLEKLEIIKCNKRMGALCLNVKTDFQSGLLDFVASKETGRRRRRADVLGGAAAGGGTDIPGPVPGDT